VNVIVDTTAWSAALRREAGPPSATTEELAALIHEGRVELLGVVRQEVLSGVRAKDHFRKLRDRLRAFEDLRVDRVDYENAGACYNECRGKGVQGSNTDFLLCAVALRRNLPIFTEDGDFLHFERVLGVKLHVVRPELAR
jgi:predicted nucleic acid-binding protein